MPPTIQASEQGLTAVRLGLPPALAFGCVNVHVNAQKLSGTRAALAIVGFSSLFSKRDINQAIFILLCTSMEGDV